MSRPRPIRFTVAALAVLAAAGCGTAARSGSGPSRDASARAAEANAADVDFMSDMIHHHGQALQMVAWVSTHGASPAIRTLGERIAVGQGDEIARMQQWLRARDQPVPEPGAPHGAATGGDHAAHGAAAGGHDAALMPGMLTAEQMGQLDRARGAEFDRLFLTYMIQHHQGAVTMVEALFRARGASQDDTVFRLATDIHADQLAEIDRMNRMLAGLPAAAN